MATLNAFPVRLKFEPPFRRDEKDTRSGDHPRVPRGNDMAATVAVYFDGTPLDLSNVASLRLELRDGRTSGATLLAAVDVLLANITTTITDADWRANLAQHATFVFAAALMNQDLGGAPEKEFLLVLSGLTADAKALTYGFTKLILVEDVTGTTAEPPPIPPDDYFTEAEVTALLAAKAPIVHTHTRAEISDATVFGRARMADADEHAARAALGADWGYTAPAAIAAAGETQISPAAGQRSRVASLTVNAGAAAFTHTVTLQAGTARAGDDLVLRVSMPASYNPLIDVRSLTAAGTQLATIVGRDQVRVVVLRFRFDGANWFLVGRERNEEAISRDEALRQFAGSSGDDWLAFDGATTNNSATWAIPATQQATFGANQPFTVILRWLAITRDAKTYAYVFSVGNSDGAYTANSFTLILRNSGLNVIRIGTDGSSRYYSLNSTFTAMKAGPGVLVITRAADGTISLWLNGNAVVLGGETVDGSPPAWTAAIDPGYVRIGPINGSGAISSIAAPPIVINRAWAQADVDAYMLARALSPEDAAGGSAVVFYAFDGTATDSWTGDALAAFDVNTTVAGKAYMQLAATGTSRMARASGLTLGVRYRVSLKLRLSAGAAATIRVGSQGANASGFDASGITGDEATFAGEFVADSATLRIGAVASNGSAYEVDDIVVTKVGASFVPQLGRNAQARDRGPNAIHGRLKPGVGTLLATVPQFEFPEYDIAATGFLGADQSLFFDAHLIERIRIRATGGMPTVTIRRGSSIGTIVVNAAVTTLNEWIEATIASGTREGAAAGEKYHVTLSASQNVRIRIYTSPL